MPQQLAGSTFRGEPSDGGDDRLGFTYDPVAFQVVFNTLPPDKVKATASLVGGG
ncbi:hypothetical protein JCM18918_1742 [Cutibacterium acnes JCM 18918]|nr:hypothetical protein JCM18918_1742 [Cutibacterium acnes JCM 18918]